MQDWVEKPKPKYDFLLFRLGAVEIWTFLTVLFNPIMCHKQVKYRAQ